MNELARIRDQIVRSVEGEAWHGPALVEVLSDLKAADAAARPIAEGHSIWEIVGHVAATIESVGARLDGRASQLGPEEDWPVVPKDRSDNEWQKAMDNLKKVHKTLIDKMADIDSLDPDRPIVEGFSSVYITLHGLAQHNIYHAGQIAILKKAIIFKR
jgi:uncharacterized damage-inducible protein DinB